MRNREKGTSVLAALVFVAIFVLFISGYKIASQNASGQAASAAAAMQAHTDVCRAGDVYTVNMASGSGNVQSLKCFIADPNNPAAVIPGPDSSRSECAQAISGKCAIRYCPPSSFVNESGECFVSATCDPSNGDNSCLRGSIQNASQPVQAANIIAAQLLADKGATTARAPGSSEPLALATSLSESGRSAVTAIINQTAEAAAQQNLDAGAIRDVAQNIKATAATQAPVGPVAQISCQPKIAESGMKVAIAFGCANSTQSSSNEFSTGGRLWGATEVRIEPNLPNGVMSYGLTCSDGSRTSVASCDVTVQKPFMLMSSQSGQSGAVSLAWVTRGMDQCDLMATDNAGLNQQIENPLTQSGALSLTNVPNDTEVVLTCTTVGGEVKEAKTTIHASN